jgi:hypothetical protein
VQKLVEFYQPHVQTLYTLSKQRLSWMDKYL